ncbi:NAD(+) synthase [Mycoplasmopsis pullorum]|uniref:NH(3)-dependent NAD(+) synthetase n=1 Tax=Mycoplasmopsis pullorum TaxID=48003 RepID=A0A1L4FRU2_9BACT|nr:NAD(+) synthase [Mycoplasmopsis pullorum]APJ38337.1 NAD(+) synthase [Mycoplasmopsis pullorum]
MNKISIFDDQKVIFNEQNAYKYIDYLVEFLRTKVSEAHAKGLIVGISGGIDSALVFALAQKAFPNDVLGVVMPIKDMSFDNPHINELEKNLNTKFLTVNLAQTNQEINKQLNLSNHLAIANVMPRLRMTTLYALAQEKGYLVCGTDNLDEYYIGYFTKYGDGGVDLLPISHLTKSEVRYLAKLLNVPDSIINKKPSAGLWEGQSDEDELGFSYAELDYFLKNENDQNALAKLKPETIQKITRMHKNSQHKRDGGYRPLSPEELKGE